MMVEAVPIRRRVGRRPENRQAVVRTIISHLEDFQRWFNEASAEKGLGIWIDPSESIDGINALSWPKLVELSKSLGHHRVHREQVVTAVEVMNSSINSPGQSGLVVGALQSGKTGTALCSLFMAPAHYLKTGLTYAPLFVTTNQNSHMEQTRQAMRSFFNLYGDLVVGSSEQSDQSKSLLEYYSDTGFDLSRKWGFTEITLHEYATNIVDDLYPGEDLVSSLVDNFTAKRVQGREIEVKIRNHCERAKKHGHGVMMIVDEPQFGASDPARNNSNGSGKCLLTQILEVADDDFFDRESPNFLVGLSATPFDSYEIESLFKVRQKIGEGYVGPNAFAGERIDPTVQEKMPKTFSFSDIAGAMEIAPFSEISWLLGLRKSPLNKNINPTVTDENGAQRELTISERRSYGAKILRRLVNVFVLQNSKKRGKKIGGLLRLAGSNEATERILDDMRVEGSDSPYNVIRFFGDHASRGSDVKRAIKEATKNDPRPYLVVVVGKGRMGDAFPPEVEIGIDLSQSPADMNAVLQGVFGRMCGYGKSNALVVMSDTAKKMVNEYSNSLGATENFSKSRHAVTNVIKKGRRAAQTYIHISEEAIASSPENSPLKRFQALIDDYLAQNLPGETKSVSVPSRKDVYFELAEAMEKTGLVEYVAANYKDIDPNMKESPRIVKPGGSSSYVKRDGSVRKLEYSFDPNNEERCKLLVSRVDAPEYLDKSQNRKRKIRSLVQEYTGSGGRHTNRGRGVGGIAPVIEVKKVDSAGRRVRPHEPGRFVFSGLNFHLEKPVAWHLPADIVTMPSDRHAMRGAMSDAEVARQLQTFVSKKLSGRFPPTLEQVLASEPCFDILSRLYNRATHTYFVTDDGVRFVDLMTEEVDNPVGPATLDFTDDRDPIITYYEQGVELEDDYVDEHPEDDLNESKFAM